MSPLIDVVFSGMWRGGATFTATLHLYHVPRINDAVRLRIVDEIDITGIVATVLWDTPFNEVHIQLVGVEEA